LYSTLYFINCNMTHVCFVLILKISYFRMKEKRMRGEF
jgi:hypothetical protein